MIDNTPYNPSEDLISREALKEELNSRPFPQDYSTTLLLGVFNELIDNAQAVQPKYSLLPLECTDMEDAFNRGYRAGKIEGILKANTNPKGEWLHHVEYTNNRPFYITECPFCKLRVHEETNFCPNCGADMRKEVKNENS